VTEFADLVITGTPAK